MCQYFHSSETFPIKYQHWLNIEFALEIFTIILHSISFTLENVTLKRRNISWKYWYSIIKNYAILYAYLIKYNQKSVSIFHLKQYFGLSFKELSISEKIKTDQHVKNLVYLTSFQAKNSLELIWPTTTLNMKRYILHVWSH